MNSTQQRDAELIASATPDGMRQRIAELEAENARLRCDSGAADITLSVTEAALATARADAVREFAEWLLLEGITLDDSDMFSGRVTPISAATRFLAEMGKEPPR